MQVKSSQPYYKWTVNGVEMVFYSESELRTQDKFLDLCMRHLHHLPNRLKNDVWTEIINTALQEMEFEEVSPEDDLSVYSIWSAYLNEFLTERSVAQRPAQIKTGLVFSDLSGLWFRPEDFVQWLENVKRFKAITLTQTHYQLRKLGITPKRLYDPATKQTIRSWFCAVEIVDKLIPDFKVEELEAKREELQAQFEPAPDVVEEKEETIKHKRGVKRLTELLEGIPDEETLDFSNLKDKEKF